MIPKFKISINENGRTQFGEMVKVDEYFKTLPVGDYFLTIKPAKEKEVRSNAQNRYLHGYLFKEIGNHLGYTIDEIKEILKSKFLKEYKTIQTKFGNIELEYVKPTHLLNTTELENFATEIREWASIEIGLYLCLPNEIDMV